MKKPVIVIGIGEMAGVFCRGLLRTGHPVYPVTRGMDQLAVAQEIPDPELVLVAVAEADLHPVLSAIPDVWKNKIGLLQNELLPNDWKQHGYTSPTVISVWFEKKKGQDFKVLVPSPIYGPNASILLDALTSLGIPSWIVDNDADMLFELVRKNIYILTTNISGLVVGGDVNSLWNEHREQALKVLDNVLVIQNHLTGIDNDRERLIEGMVEAINGDLQHQCMGRSAPARLQRALDYATDNSLEVPELKTIAARVL